MINTEMRLYDYYTLAPENEYGQRVLPEDAQPQGKIKMAIFTSSQTIQDNILYQNCEYIGLTHSAALTDECVIDYEGQKLKVLYIAPKSRLKSVFMARVV